MGQVLGLLGSIYERQGRLDDAERWYRLAFEAKRKMWGPSGSGELANELWGLARVYKRRGDLAPARLFYEDALRLYMTDSDVRNGPRNPAPCVERELQEVNKGLDLGSKFANPQIPGVC